MAPNKNAVPWLQWLPINPVTYDEWHSAVMGLVGLVAGGGAAAGEWAAVLAFSTVTIGIAWGLKKLPEQTHPVCARVIRREPWYFTGVYAATAALAYWGIA